MMIIIKRRIVLTDDPSVEAVLLVIDVDGRMTERRC